MPAELGGLTNKPCLATDLAKAMSRLIATAGNDLPAVGRSAARRVLKRIAERAPRGPASGSVTHSLAAPQTLPEAFGRHARPARRIAIVTPAYASTHDRKAAALLATHVGAETEVDLYTGAALAVGEKNRPARAAAGVSEASLPYCRVGLKGAWCSIGTVDVDLDRFRAQHVMRPEAVTT